MKDEISKEEINKQFFEKFTESADMSATDLYIFVKGSGAEFTDETTDAVITAYRAGMLAGAEWTEKQQIGQPIRTADALEIMDTGILNEPMKAYIRQAMKRAGTDQDTQRAIMNSLREMLDLFTAAEILEEK